MKTHPRRLCALARRSMRAWLIAATALWLALSPCLGRVAVAAPRAAESDHERSAFALGREALAHYQAGRFGAAEQLYLRAWHLRPGSPEYIYGAGLAARAAGDAMRARGHFETVLATAPAGHVLRPRAVRHLAELAATAAAPQQPAPSQQVDPTPAPAAQLAGPATPEMASAPHPVTPTAAPPPDAEPGAPGRGHPNLAITLSVSPPPRANRRPALAALISAGLLLSAGGSLAAVAWGDQRALDGKRLSDGRYDLAQVSVAQARADQQSINDTWAAGGLAAGLGLVAAVAGWVLLGETPAVGHSAGAGAELAR